MFGKRVSFIAFLVLVTVCAGCSQKKTNTLVKDMQTTMGSNIDAGKKVSADTVIQASNLSWAAPMEISIDGDMIYLGNIAYEQINEKKAPDVQFDETILVEAKNTKDGNSYVSDILTKMKDSNSYYVLTTDKKSPYGSKVIVYEIDNKFYFLSSFDDETIMRIYGIGGEK